MASSLLSKGGPLVAEKPFTSAACVVPRRPVCVGRRAGNSVMVRAAGGPAELRDLGSSGEKVTGAIELAAKLPLLESTALDAASHFSIDVIAVQELRLTLPMIESFGEVNARDSTCVF